MSNTVAKLTVTAARKGQSRGCWPQGRENYSEDEVMEEERQRRGGVADAATSSLEDEVQLVP